MVFNKIESLHEHTGRLLADARTSLGTTEDENNGVLTPIVEHLDTSRCITTCAQGRTAGESFLINSSRYASDIVIE